MSKPTETNEWQWLYSVQNSNLWNITPYFMNEDTALKYKESYNESHKHFPIIEFKKVNPVKRFINDTDVNDVNVDIHS